MRTFVPSNRPSTFIVTICRSVSGVNLTLERCESLTGSNHTVCQIPLVGAQAEGGAPAQRQHGQERAVEQHGHADEALEAVPLPPRHLPGKARVREQKPLLPYVLCLGVGLLSIEWLTRKLLRLA